MAKSDGVEIVLLRFQDFHAPKQWKFRIPYGKPNESMEFIGELLCTPKEFLDSHQESIRSRHRLFGACPWKTNDMVLVQDSGDCRVFHPALITAEGYKWIIK